MKSRVPRTARKGRSPAGPAAAPAREGATRLRAEAVRQAPPDLLRRGDLKGEKALAAAATLGKTGIRKYEIGEEIGRGSMGTVHLARDVNCRRIVALKRMKPSPDANVEDLIRFIEEAQITSQLEHPNIVPVHELGLDDEGRVYYTMKHVKGVSLADVLIGLRKGDEEMINQYPLARLLTIFQKACDAMAFAHARHVLHRDLKPQNIMIGDFGEVLVMDLGLAKVIEAMQPPAARPPSPAEASLEDSLSALLASVPKAKLEQEGIRSIRADKLGSSIKTMRGTVMGTPGFMAPEQVLNENVGIRADVYSLGGILYSILTLRQSVTGDIRGMLRKILTGDIIPPVQYNTAPAASRAGGEEPPRFPHCPDRLIPAALSDIAMKALSVEPEDRFQSVTELQREVEAYQNGIRWQLVLDDDFSDPDLEARWKTISGKSEIAGGELRLHGGGQHLLVLRQEVRGDVRIEFECRQESVYLNDIGCFMSAVRSDHWNEVYNSAYVFQYGAFDNSLNQLLRSEQTLWSEAASPLVRGRALRVCAERAGSRLRLAVDGREVFEVTDKDSLSGDDRTAVGIAGSTADTRISRIRVYTCVAPWRADVLDFAEREMLKGHYTTAMDLYQAALDSSPSADRLQLARKGYEAAGHRKQMEKEMPDLRRALEEAWPGVRVELRMDNDGLALDINHAGIEDLGPLWGLPLKKLYCMNNRITSLEPLRGMPLEVLHCGGNPVASLEPLRGMNLVTLLCEDCAFGDLEPLRGGHLRGLCCSGNRLATGLEPLRGQPLDWLICAHGGISSLEPLRGMSLTALLCDANAVTDLEPLRGMRLSTLHCDFNRITSLEPLRGMPLTKLHAANNEIASLEPLRGMALKMVSCPCNRITSLEPLGGSPVAALVCAGNRLSSLRPFVQKPPHRFLFDCDTLPAGEIEKALALWSRHKRLAIQARDARVLLALRRGDRRELRSIAAAFQGRRYLFIPKFLAWEEARAFCERLGGHLVTITGSEENQFVDSLLPGGSWFWIGLRVAGPAPQWVTGEPYGFSAFRDATAEKSLGGKVFDSGAWSAEASPEAPNCFMIEWDE